MKKINFKNIYPYLIAIGIFIVLGYTYFPQMFEGKELNQHDITSWRASAQEIFKFRETTGGEPLWTGSMFSGMPSNMISIHYPGNYTTHINQLFYIFKNPAAWYIVSMIGFYLLLLCFKVDRWVAIVGAIAFTFCAYNFIIIQAGHNNKMAAISYMPWVLASVVYAYRYKPIPGAVFLGITMSLEILTRHPQITFYLGFLVLFYVISEAIVAFKQKLMPRFIKTSVIVLIGAGLGFACNINNLWPNMEYSKYTMRGGSELSSKGKEVGTSGLSNDYALSWSYGIEETANLLIPNFNGGASGTPLGKKSETYQFLKQAGSAAEAEQMIKQMPTYWGPQPFTSGPMYLGAISVFFFVLGLILIKGQLKWWIASISLLAILLAWGRHFVWFSNIFLEYVPLYNKFRAPSTIITILQLTVPLLGFYTVSLILRDKIEKKQVIKGMKIALGITAGFCALFAVIPSLAGSFTSPADAQFPEWLQRTLPADRKSMLQADAIRSLVYILLAAGTLWLGFVKRIKFKYTVLILGVLVLADMWTIDKRYLNDSHFVTSKEYNRQFKPRPVDTEILKDKDPNYRVLDLTVNTFNDAVISYFHKTIGGYSAAKLQRYQEMIDYHILPEMQQLIKSLQQSNSLESIDSTLAQLGALNMLNAKYIVINPNGMPLLNQSALGNAWFVTDYKFVNSPDEEILALNSIDPAKTAVIDKKFAGLLNDRQFTADSTASIQLLSYAPNQLEYKYTASRPQLAVFSEVYYPVGWKAYIDGQKADHFRVDYILRGMILPEGEHTVTFKYIPDSYYTSARISQVASSLLIILFVAFIVLYGGGFMKPRNTRKE